MNEDENEDLGWEPPENWPYSSNLETRYAVYRNLSDERPLKTFDEWLDS